MPQSNPTVLIVGAGQGLSASLTRRFRNSGANVAIASRSKEKLEPLARETGARAFACDASQLTAVRKLFADVEEQVGSPDVVIYNPSGRVRGSFVDLDPVEVERSLAVTAFGGFLVSQAAAQRMVPRGRGVILLTGASASVKGYAKSAPFAMGKFALRGLAQSMARELSPLGIHVAHVIIDGGIRAPGLAPDPAKPNAQLEADAIAETYFYLSQQPKSAWSWEIEVRPWVERF
jgi:NAD(P)-dependent dehydrogenase (short-subunit alcohol dehydrogenase family)